MGLRAVVRAASVLSILCGVFALPAASAKPEEQRARVERLENRVLAPCCYTEPVSRHQSEIAVKMRIEIAKWVAAGKTDREILDAYVERYGAKVLIDPRTAPAWWAPWIPWLTLITGTVLLLRFLKRWRPVPRPSPPSQGDSVVEVDDDDLSRA
jgi:cytochrome c-type biogenesis protein CcmH/NrfF